MEPHPWTPLFRERRQVAISAQAVRDLEPGTRHFYLRIRYTGPGIRGPGIRWPRNSLPRRWVVERTIAWLNRNRRLAKDFERTIESATTWLFIASVNRITRRIANLCNHATSL
ncbi:transposase [Novosphingobium sp. Fuku2-ISO-50]|uniref:transposase n=1 Tax=Novosphingobium sp. Fuku2-ISO-50 TaxID=1739114 RepID=UPI00350EAD37